jgi:probable rRNA maturation factor
MNHVAVTHEGVPSPVWRKSCVGFCLKILKDLGKTNWEVSLVFCDDNFIRDLNRRYRHLDHSTDVLTFPQAEGETPPATRPGEDDRFMAGDVVISLDRLRANSKNYGVSENEELKRLLVHGLLHLTGQDHPSDSPDEPMLMEQERLLKKLNKERII